MKRSALGLFVALFPSLALAQGALLQAGPSAPGRVPMYVSQGNSQAIVQDSGPAAGGGPGLGLAELLLTMRGHGQPPYAGQGSGPLGTNFCNYDAPTTNPSGYHYLCMSPNTQGGGVLAYGAGGMATPLPFFLIVNGVPIQFPGPGTGDVSGPVTSTPGDFAFWDDTEGRVLRDGGAPAPSAMIDTTNASNITSGTLSAARIADNSLGISKLAQIGSFVVLGNLSGSAASVVQVPLDPTTLAVNSGTLGVLLNYPTTSGLPLTNTSPQSPVPTNSLMIVQGTTTTTTQNFLAQFNLISDSISDNRGGAVAMDIDMRGTANSGGIWAIAASAAGNPGFNASLHNIFGAEIDVGNIGGPALSDLAAGNTIGVSLNGLGYRATAGVYINNVQLNPTTVASTAAGNTTLTFGTNSLQPFVAAGANLFDSTTPAAIPAGTTVVSATTNSIVMSAGAATGGVLPGDVIIISQPLWYQGIKIAPFAVSQYGFRDVSNSMTAFEAEGHHTYNIDISGATALGFGIRLGSGESQGIGAHTPAGDSSAIWVDATGQTIIGTGAPGQIEVRGNVLPTTANQFVLGTIGSPWFGMVSRFYSGGGPVPTITTGAGTLSTGSNPTHGTMTETGTGTGYVLTMATRGKAPDCVVTSPSGVGTLTYSTTATTLTVAHASIAAAVTTYECWGE